MVKKFIVGVLILMLVTLVSTPVKLINSGHSDKYKVRVMLNTGREITGYVTKADYENYLRKQDLKLTGRTIQYELIHYVVQTYNPYGDKERNLPIHY